MADSDWKTFDIATELARRAESGEPYREFLRVPALSCGVYTLPKGAEDLQFPHDEDEVYYILEGRARVRVGDDERPVGPGSVLYVRATSKHSFFEIEESLTLLVFFASGGPSS